MSVTIENESAYPIYSVKVRWVQDIDPSYDPSPWQVEGSKGSYLESHGLGQHVPKSSEIGGDQGRIAARVVAEV